MTFKKVKHKKMIMTACLAASLSFIIPLASCGAISENLVTNTLSKADGAKFTSDISLKDMSIEALKNEEAQKAILSYYSGKLALEWFEKVAAQPTQIQYRNLLADKKKSINDEYKNKLNEYKTKHGANASLLFQQEVLDPAGGTEQSWKNFALIDWAKTELISKLFEKNYLTIIKDGKVNNFPSESELTTALEDSKDNFDKNNLIKDVTKGFIFSTDAITSGRNTYVDNQYSAFQQFVYNKWTQIQTPFVINMSLWKYSQPEKGISHYYKAASDVTTDEEGNQTGGGASYNFPYFSNGTDSNDKTGTLTLFSNFISAATATNKNFTNGNTNGLKFIPKEYTEDSSTYILAKTGSIYNDLYPEFAAAATYLLGKFMNVPSIDIDTQIKKTVSTSTSSAYDLITSNFVSASNTSSNTGNGVILKQSLMQNIINENGPLKNEIKDTFVIDAFLAENNLDEFMFLRNEAGVHAISIDGSTYIKTNGGSDIEKSRYLAGNIVLYRSLWSSKLNTTLETNAGLSININSELSSFFNSWADSLIWEYAKATQGNATKNLFDLNSLKLSTEEIDMLTKLVTYINDRTLNGSKESFQNKMFETKNKYAQNYGVNTKNNGLAAPWIYTGTALGGGGEYQYLLTNVVNNGNDPYTTSGSQSSYFTAISTFLNSITLTPLASSYEGFKYSQYIYSNYESINKALLAFGNDGTSIANLVKIKLLEQNLSSVYDKTKMEFTNGIGDTTIAGYLNQSLTNLFFSSNFNSATNKWANYSAPSTPPTPTIQTINTHRKNMWIKANRSYTAASFENYYNLLSVIASVKYLLQDNGKLFLEYLKDQINYGTDTYAVWFASQNSYLTTSKVTTSADLENKLEINVNNSFKSAFTNKAPDKTNEITLNNKDSFFNNDNKSYYNYIDNKVGFLGIQTSSKNELPSTISEILFTNPRFNNNKKGLLYSYGTKTDLINYINRITLTETFDALVNEVQDRTKALNTSIILDSKKTFTEKKQAFISQLNAITFDAEWTQARNDNLSTNLITDKDSSNLEYAAYVKQINFSNLNNISSLKTAIGDEAFYNLVIQAAMDSSIQFNAISILSFTLKTDVYDLNLYNKLGYQWVKNWKR